MTKLEANLIADCLLFVEVLIFWRVMFLVLKKKYAKAKAEDVHVGQTQICL